jgi:hypothetical protein
MQSWGRWGRPHGLYRVAVQHGPLLRTSNPATDPDHRPAADADVVFDGAGEAERDVLRCLAMAFLRRWLIRMTGAGWPARRAPAACRARGRGQPPVALRPADGPGADRFERQEAASARAGRRRAAAGDGALGSCRLRQGLLRRTDCHRCAAADGAARQPGQRSRADRSRDSANRNPAGHPLGSRTARRSAVACSPVWCSGS